MFNGEGGGTGYTAGVAIVIHSSFSQYIEDLEPINDRIMYSILEGTMLCTRIFNYMLQSDRPCEEKQQHMKNYKNIVWI